MAPNNQKCSSCYFYDRIDANTGLCRTASPPTTLNSGGPTVTVTWPTVQKNDWCGRFVLGQFPGP
jgi:hypothetical protein